MRIQQAMFAVLLAGALACSSSGGSTGATGGSAGVSSGGNGGTATGGSGATDAGGTDAGGGDSGMPPSTGTTAMGLVVGGGVSASTNYRLVSSTVYGAAAGASPASSNYVLRGGVVGRTAAP